MNQEWGRYDEIEKDLLDMAYLKRAAFNDSSIEEMEREIISELSHRGLNTIEANFGRRSENSEALNSVKSSQDYWQEDLKVHPRNKRAREEKKVENTNN